MSRKLNKNRKTQRKATPKKTSKYLSKTVEIDNPNINRLIHFKNMLKNAEDQENNEDQIMKGHIEFLKDFETNLKDNGYTELDII